MITLLSMLTVRCHFSRTDPVTSIHELNRNHSIESRSHQCVGQWSNVVSIPVAGQGVSTESFDNRGKFRLQIFLYANKTESR